MKKIILLSFAFFTLTAAFAAKPKHSYVSITTAKGTTILLLYNSTPKHRDNFLKLANDKFYDGTLFHRVIQNFMIQGGDPDSKNAKAGVALGEGGLKYTVDAEFKDSLFHKKGALAAARDNNPAKASSSTQFYIVHGKVFTDEQLDALEASRLQGRKIPGWQREVYRSVGGTPHLDQNYTVYGEVVMGIEMIDKIAAMSKDGNDRPLENIPMKVAVLKRSEAKFLEKLLPALASKP